MVWVSLGLLSLTVFVVFLNTQRGRWKMANWDYPRRSSTTFQEHLETLDVARRTISWTPASQAISQAVIGVTNAIMQNTEFFIFSWVILIIVIPFLLPLWSLTFATEAIGREREVGNLIWLFTRPLPRWSVYLAKFVSLLPWSIGFNVGGFALICLAAGPIGPLAFERYWPAMVMGTLAFSAFFHFLAVLVPKPAIIAILYSFFLETLVGNLPGYLKRASISFYTRCLMFDAAQDYQIVPERETVFLKVEGATAWVILAGLTVLFLIAGMTIFSRKEYRELG